MGQEEGGGQPFEIGQREMRKVTQPLLRAESKRYLRLENEDI